MHSSDFHGDLEISLSLNRIELSSHVENRGAITLILCVSKNLDPKKSQKFG